VTVSASPHPLFWVAGTVTRIGQRARDHETATFDSLEICRRGGQIHRFTAVRASDHVAALVEHNCIATFFFWSQPDELRLWCVARADGPRCVDLDTMHKILPEARPSGGGATHAC
jgi:hypothetical protein